MRKTTRGWGRGRLPQLPTRRWRIFVIAAVVGLAGVYWLLPLNAQLVLVSDAAQADVGVWPHAIVEPQVLRPGERVLLTVRDVRQWPDVKLFVAHRAAQFVATSPNMLNGDDGGKTWQWTFTVPANPNFSAVFYHDCQTGCIEGGRFHFGTAVDPPTPTYQPTKMGVVFADPERNWHGRAGWDVELLYSQLDKDPDFSLDPLAERVLQNSQHGLHVLVRIDYDRGQSLPPSGDNAALARYLGFCARLARDARLKDVYGYIIGSSFNRTSANSLAVDHPVTADWYARLFGGYGLDPKRSDNVVQTFRTIDSHLRVLVGPVAPWVSDQTGTNAHTPSTPWLDYMNTLVSDLEGIAIAKEAIGYSMGEPDGFAVQAPGRPEAADVAAPAQEPDTDVHLSQWGDAQFGFRVYRDWLTIINRYSTTRGLPVYITSTNTYAPDTQIEPIQNYPAGWLTTAATVINREPQIKALCWYVDLPYDKWSSFSLRMHVSRLGNAAKEFDQLLQ